MNEDLKNKLIAGLTLSKEMILTPVPTAKKFKETLPPWKDLFLDFALPVLLVVFVLGFVLSAGTRQYAGFGGMGLSFKMSVMQLVLGTLNLFVFAAVFNFFTKYFDAKPSFNLAFAAVTLSLVPCYLIGLFSVMPLFGGLIALAGGIYALYIAYQVVPLYLGVPKEKEATYFIVSFIVCIVINGPISMMFFNVTGMKAMTRAGMHSSVTSDASVSGGLFNGIMPDQKYIVAAEEDRYTPPTSGKLTDKQVKKYLYFKSKVVELQDEAAKSLEALNGDVDVDDLGWREKMKIAKGAMSVGTAEIRVVKSGKGNWAEHQWVQQQIESARIHYDSDSVAAHNYKLYQKHAK